MATNRPHFGGVESEQLKRLREATLEKMTVTRCGFCNVSLRASASKGIRWFQDHTTTEAHKQAVDERRNGSA